MEVVLSMLGRVGTGTYAGRILFLNLYILATLLVLAMALTCVTFAAR